MTPFKEGLCLLDYVKSLIPLRVFLGMYSLSTTHMNLHPQIEDRSLCLEIFSSNLRKKLYSVGENEEFVSFEVTISVFRYPKRGQKINHHKKKGMFTQRAPSEILLHFVDILGFLS